MKDTKRVTVDFSSNLYDRLCEMVTVVGADSKAEIIRDSLRIYEYFSSVVLDGWEVNLKKGEEEKTIVLFRLTPNKSPGGA